MSIHSRRSLAATLVVLLAFLPGFSAIVVADEARDRAALEAAAQAWIKAFDARDADALVAFATDDVVLIDPNVAAPVSGRDAARVAWSQALGAAQGQVTSATKEAVIAGDVAWRMGALTNTLPNASVNAVNRGQSLEIWKRVNGQWKLHRQMASGILTQPRLRPPPSEPVLDTPRN